MMQVDRSIRKAGPCSPCLLPEDPMNGGLMLGSEADEFLSSGSSSSFSCSSSSTWPARSAAGANSIEHRVSKKETLAGVAIRYGVEVADIMRMNGLVTDIQMFAFKSLQIPLPGRHPPSSNLSDGSSSRGLKSQWQSISPAMRNLQGYYGLRPTKSDPGVEGIEMDAYKTVRRHRRVSSVSDQRPCHHRKTRSSVDVFALMNGGSVDAAAAEATENCEIDRSSGKSLRVHPSVDSDLPLQAPELLLKDDTSTAVSGRAGNRLALRPKAGNRIHLDPYCASVNLAEDSTMADASFAVRKSSSTSNLQEPDTSSLLRPTASKWSLRPDAIARPFFDGLANPMTARRNKAALD